MKRPYPASANDEGVSSKKIGKDDFLGVAWTVPNTNGGRAEPFHAAGYDPPRSL